MTMAQAKAVTTACPRSDNRLLSHGRHFVLLSLLSSLVSNVNAFSIPTSTSPTFVATCRTRDMLRLRMPLQSSSTISISTAALSMAASSENAASAAASSIKDITSDASDRMTKSIDSVKLSLTSIRTGRASASILDRVKVDYYGALTPLNQLAGISVPSAQQLSIDAYDKSALNAIERAISDSDLGLTCSNDGSLIRINIPALTEERRKELLKQCKSIGEEGKVAVRNVRRDGVDTIKKLEKAKTGTVGEDEMKDGLDVMQKMTDKSIKEIDEIVAKKEKEVMTV